MVHTTRNETYIFVLTAGGAIWVKKAACMCLHRRESATARLSNRGLAWSGHVYHCPSTAEDYIHQELNHLPHIQMITENVPSLTYDHLRFLKS